MSGALVFAATRNMCSALAALLLLASPGSPVSAAKPEPLRLHDSGSDVQLHLLPDRSLMRLHGGATLSGAERAAALSRLLQQPWPAGVTGPTGQPWLLLFGRYPELEPRLGELARCAADWDAARGRPRTGAGGDWLRRHFVPRELVPELAAAVQAPGAALELDAAEQLMLCRPDAIDWKAAEAACPGARPPARGRYACGAALVFQLRPAGPALQEKRR